MRIYFLGICGTAMGNAALLLREEGHVVCGADTEVYPPMSDVLSDSGIAVYEGYDAERLAQMQPERVVIGNAISRGNVEVEWLLNQSVVPFVSLPQLLHESVLHERLPVVITGTHGKTTTSTLTAFLLQAAGAEPGWLIGGVPRDLAGGAKLGDGAVFVIEGDEYDTAFFDKRSKFIHYRPQIAVINNLEFDHADIFRDLEDVLRTFRHFLRIIPSEGWLLLNGDDENVLSLLPAPWTRSILVGTGATNDLVISNFSDSAAGSSFDLHWREKFWARVEWPLHGLFNARNAAMAALSAALSQGLESPVGFDLSRIANFRGVKRRQEVLHQCEKWTVLEDFAHHPTAIAGALEALRSAYPQRELVVSFEPRSNTARTSLFQTAFTQALSSADHVYLGAVHRADSMQASARLNTTQMVADLLQQGAAAAAFECNQALYQQIELDCGKRLEGAVYIFFTNGAFDGVPQRTAELFMAS